jgi:RHS repeat-associated protein
VVQKYEPFYSTGYGYAAPADAQFGHKTAMFYDPRGQLIRTVNPDGSQTVVVLGIPPALDRPDRFHPTPWETYTYDANDNAGRTHPDESAGYADHRDTPASIEVDALGRTVTAVARNGPADADRIVTRTTYDIQGNIVGITDALDRTAFGYRFDLLKRRWRMDSIDAGRRDSVPDAAGRIVEARDSKGALTLAAFDPVHRPSRVWARDSHAGAVTLRERIDYGDSGDPHQDDAARQAARARNLLGRAVRSYDEAGLIVSGGHDFKGNPLQTTRQVIADTPILATYTEAATHGWQVAPFTVDWTPALGQTQDARDAELLDPTGYTHDTAYDGLNRVTRRLLPAEVAGHRAVLTLAYNRAGALDAVSLDDTVYVQRISYDAKGQRALIAYGNGVMTRYAYDAHTFRLVRLRTEPYAVDDVSYRPAGTVLQDLGYEHDLTGNILAIHDRTPSCGVPPTRDALDRTFTYDPVYRLLSATGREQQTPVSGDPWTDISRGTDPTQTQHYTETYQYDPVGNLVRLAHQPNAPHLTSGFTRKFANQPGNNRLQQMTVGDIPYDYEFDDNGNLTAETMARQFTWNHADRLAAFATRTPDAEPSVHAHHLYDSNGQRVVKLVRRQGGLVEVTRYVDGFEHHRWPGGANNHTHVMDDKQRIALVRSGDAHPDDRGPAVAFQLADHLGSAGDTVDGFGTLTNREEYTPYGETSFGSYTRKRYRFTGRERDEESGLAYHCARYYAPWRCRWSSTDPIGPGGGMNVYAYCNNSPIMARDLAGTSPEDGPPKGIIGRTLGWFKGRAKEILTGGRLATGEADDIAEAVEDAAREITNKPKPPAQGGSSKPKTGAQGSTAPEPVDKRLATARDLHANRNLGNASAAPDKRLATASDLHANRNIGNASAVPDKRSATASDLHANRDIGNASAVPDKRLATASDLHANRNIGNASAVPDKGGGGFTGGGGLGRALLTGLEIAGDVLAVEGAIDDAEEGDYVGAGLNAGSIASLPTAIVSGAYHLQKAEMMAYGAILRAGVDSAQAYVLYVQGKVTPQEVIESHVDLSDWPAADRREVMDRYMNGE